MTAILTAGDALLADILAKPDDDGIRLIYADWLEEEGGDPGWAAVIRLGIEYAANPDKRSELKRPLDVASSRRFPRHDWDVVDWTWDRGFIATVSLPLAAWRRHGPGLAQAHPITRVELSDREPLVGMVTVGWYREGHRLLGSNHCLPDKLLGLLQGFDQAEDGREGFGVIWSGAAMSVTLARASNALSDALLASARLPATR